MKIIAYNNIINKTKKSKMFKNFGKKGQPDSQMPSLNPPGGPILDQEMVPVQGAPPVQMSLLPKGGPPQGGNN